MSSIAGAKTRRPAEAPARSNTRCARDMTAIVLYIAKYFAILERNGASAMRSRRLRVKFILPALTEATSPSWRPIKYSLFPPLGLATLAAYLPPDDEAEIVDEHVGPLNA